jgi:predicted RecA/RadA family phage recombinase
MAIARTKEADLASSDYEFITATAAAAKTAGTMETIEDVSGFPLVDVVSGDKYTLIIKASQVSGKKAVEAIDDGDKIYWDDSASVFTKVATDNALMGYAVEAAASADTHVLFNFNGKGVAII